MQEIVIDIDPTGNSVKIEGKNFTGNECTALTKEIEQELGAIEKRMYKPEYRQAKSVMRKAGA